MKKNKLRIKHVISTLLILCVLAIALTVLILICKNSTVKISSGYIDEITPNICDDNKLQTETEHADIAAYEENTVTRKSEGKLILVNWNNPVPYERPDNLKILREVFTDEVMMTNPDGLIDLEAGQMAKNMFSRAKAEGYDKFILSSAYRSISYQQQLFDARKAQDASYGDKPYLEPVKVLPGKNSEHTTGLALDILIDGIDEEEYFLSDHGKWLNENAANYGFILRYPEGKEHLTGVIYEPWHYRYVGVEAAKEIKAKGMCLEEYVTP